MSSLIYHRAEPQQKKDSYEQFDSLDFNIDVGEGRVLVKNSVRLVADLAVLDNGVRNATFIHYDPRAGGHAFIDSIQTEFEGSGSVSGGQKENISNYARSVVMEETAMKCPEDALNASSVCELKGYDGRTAILFSKGTATRNTTGASIAGDTQFGIKLNNCLNKMSGGDLPYSKSGMVRVSINLAPNSSALMGSALNNTQDSYTLKNPRL